jgi:hypothetical protein
LDNGNFHVQEAGPALLVMVLKGRAARGRAAEDFLERSRQVRSPQLRREDRGRNVLDFKVRSRGQLRKANKTCPPLRMTPLSSWLRAMMPKTLSLLTGAPAED